MGSSGENGFAESVVGDRVETVCATKNNSILFQTIFTNARHRLQSTTCNDSFRFNAKPISLPFLFANFQVFLDE